MNDYVQLMIMMFSCASIVMITRKNNRWLKWGLLTGLCGQPFWMWSTYESNEWGMFITSVLFAAVYVSGLRNHWRKS